MANLFRSIPIRKPKRNFFDLSHEVLTTTSMGVLTPFFIEPVVPRDKFKVQTQILCRMAPTLAPIFARVNIYTHFFFIPNRLLWNQWEDFITKGASGTDAPVYPTYSLIETVTPVSDSNIVHDSVNGSSVGGKRSLCDYLGFQVLPDSYPGSSATTKVQYDALPFRAYQLVYDEYYRDQSLESPVTANVHQKDGDPIGSSQNNYLSFLSGNSTYSRSSADETLLTGANRHWSPFRLRRRAWEKDYFTSALPWPQRGRDVNIPIDISNAGDVVLKPNGGYPLLTSPGITASGGDVVYGISGVPSGRLEDSRDIVVDGKVVKIDPNGSLGVNLQAGAGVTINDLRRSIKLQEFYEKDARGGSRYIEKILSHFGVRSSDARLQRPEYLGGGISPIIVSEVLQQSQSSETSPLGNMAGHGISAQVTHQFKRSFEEHGWILGIISIMPKATYMQGTPRKFLKRDFFDFYWPEFANLGEQPILKQELYTNPNATNNPLSTQGDGGNNSIFGYTPRYAEYKFSPGRVCGDFKDDLSFWHLSRNLQSAPSLGYDFIYEPPTKRVFAVTDEYSDPFWLQIYNQVHALRPMPKFGVPII